jgi:hypothetical protein
MPHELKTRADSCGISVSGRTQGSLDSSKGIDTGGCQAAFASLPDRLKYQAVARYRLSAGALVRRQACRGRAAAEHLELHTLSDPAKVTEQLAESCTEGGGGGGRRIPAWTHFGLTQASSSTGGRPLCRKMRW